MNIETGCTREEQEEQEYLKTIQNLKIYRKYKRNNQLLNVIESTKCGKFNYSLRCQTCQGLLSYQMVQTRSMDEGMTPIYHCRSCKIK